jgi:hypothetical protein
MTKVDGSSSGIIQCGVFVSNKIEAEIAKSWNRSAEKSHGSCRHPVSREELIYSKQAAGVNKKSFKGSHELD